MEPSTLELASRLQAFESQKQDSLKLIKLAQLYLNLTDDAHNSDLQIEKLLLDLYS